MNAFFKINNVDYLIAFIGYFFIALFILNRVLFFSPGTVGFFHDWPIGPYPEMSWIYGNGGFYDWDSQLGNKLYPTDWIFRIILIPFSFLGGEVLTKGLLVLAITLSGFGAFCLGKRLKLSPYSSFAAGILYIFSPIIFTRIIAGHIYYLVAYFLSPFILSSFLKGKEEKSNCTRYKYFIISGILTSIAVIQIQFLVMIFIVLVIFCIIDFGRIKKSMLGLIVIFSITFLINLSPVVLSDVLNNKTIQPTFNNPLQLLLYNGIIGASSLTESMRLLGYAGHPYSYAKIGTSEDPLRVSDIEEMHIKLNLAEKTDFIRAVYNSSGQSKLPTNWSDPFGSCNVIFKCQVINSNIVVERQNITGTFQLSTNITNRYLWSHISGKEIDVKSSENYGIITHMKLNKYATQSHILIEGYNETSNKWYPFKTQCPSGIDGSLEWHEFACEITIPSGSSKIRPVLKAGWSSQPGKEAITWYDGIGISKLNDTSVVISSWIFYLDFLLPIVGFSALIYRKDNHHVISFALISLIGLFLMKGLNPPLPAIFNFIFIHGFFIFRELWHVAFLYGFGISFLIAFFIERLIAITTTRSLSPSRSDDYTRSAKRTPQYHRTHFHLSISSLTSLYLFSSFPSSSYYYRLKKYHRIILSSFLVSLIVISNGYPLVIGNFGGYLQTFNFPKEYHEIYKNLLTNNTYNTLILPLFANIQYDDLKLSGTDPLLEYSSTNIFEQYVYNNLPTTGLSTWLHSVMQENKTNNLGKLLSGFGIKYIILRKDFVSNYPHYISLGSYVPFIKRWYSSLEPFLDTQKDLVVISNTALYKIYENTVDAKKIFIPLVVANGLSQFRRLLYISNFTALSNIAVYPSDFNNNHIRSNNLKDENMSSYDFTALGQYTTSTNPNEGWTTNRDWFGYNYLLASRIHLGAFSLAHNSKFSFDLSLPKYKNKTIEMWIRPFIWSKGGTVNISINGKQSLYSFSSQYSKFPLIKIFDGISNASSYHFLFTNIVGSNYIEGIYIKEKNNIYDPTGLIDNQNITHINFDKLNSAERPPINKFTKINPTLWDSSIKNVSKPFTLAFAEPYDSSWEATVYKDGKKIAIAHSQPLYSTINGFQISQTGNLDIVIRYGPQDWFKIGLIISGITFIFCLFYILFDWRKNKRDGWLRKMIK